MIAEAVPDASARVFFAERKATTTFEAAGTSTSSKTPLPAPPAPPPPLPVSASFARSNPWTDLSSPLDLKQRLLLLCCVPLLLWRLFLTAVILPCVHLCFWALVAGQDLGSPLSPWRARCTNALLRFWSGGLLFLAFGVLPRIKNGRREWEEIVEEAKAQRAVVVFNHVSYLDGLAVVSLLQPCCAAKKQVASLPFFGVWSRALQFLFIERSSPSSSSSSSSSSPSSCSAAADSAPASKSEGAAAAMARRAADARFPLLAVSPEGTTKSQHCLLRFKTGAFVAGRPVLPLCLDYRRRGRGGRGRGEGGRAAAPSPPSPLAGALGSLLASFFGPAAELSNFNPGWGLLQSDGFHVLRACMSPWTPLSVEALPLMRPRAAAAAAAAGGGGGEGLAEFAERVRAAMSLALDAPRVDLGVEDWARLKAAGVAVDPSGTKVLWRPGGPGTERVEVVMEEEEEGEDEGKKET